MQKNNFTGLPDPKRPLMIMRLRAGHEQNEVWDRLFPQLVQTKDCCDEVWFSTGIGMPVLADHQYRSDLMAAHAEDLRKVGIIPSLQIQATLGHSDRITASAGAEGKTWGSYVGVNGEQCQYINCPRQEGFLKYFREVSKIYAQWKPGSVWIDDDLRLYNHNPASAPLGCYCKDCLAAFSKEEGHDYTREELVEAYKKDPELYKRWQNFGERSLEQIAKIIVETFLEYSPETRFGLQHNTHLERLPVMETLYKYAGKRIGSRPGGGTYSDHNPYTILDKALVTSMQIISQPGYETMISQVTPEIESCPRTFTCKTSQGHRLESLLYLAAGCDSLSYFIMDPYLETPEWYGSELLAPLAAEAPCYKDYIQHNTGALPGGLALGTNGEGHTITVVSELGLPLIGVPFAAASPANCGTIITQRSAETLSVEELEKLLAKGCILDGYAVMALQERGLNHLLGNIRVDLLKASVSEYFTDDPMNTGYGTVRHSPLHTTQYRFEVPAGLDHRVLGVYRDAKKNDYGIASMIFTTPTGGRCGLVGYEGFNIHYTSSDRVRMLNRIADWISGETLPVRTVEPAQLVLMPAVTAEKELRSVTILNPTIGIQKRYEIILRGVPADCKEMYWYVPAETPVKVEFVRKDNECHVIMPEITAWNVGWLKIG